MMMNICGSAKKEAGLVKVDCVLRPFSIAGNQCKHVGNRYNDDCVGTTTMTNM